MAVADHSMLGAGIYSPTEAARYVRARKYNFRRWIYGSANGQPVIDPVNPRDGRREMVTFVDFAQALLIQDIRLNVGIPLQKIRDAYETARSEYKVPYPFAVENKIVVFGNLNDPKHCQLAILRPDDPINIEALEKKYVLLTGKKKGDILISEVVQKFSKNLFYSEKGLANRYVAYNGYGHRILIEPDVRFGKPHLEDLDYEAETLASAVAYEGGVARVSELYEVPESAVKAALAYMKELDQDPEPIKPKKIGWWVINCAAVYWMSRICGTCG